MLLPRARGRGDEWLERVPGRAIGGRDVRWREKPGPRDPGAVGGVPVFGAHRLIGGPQDNATSETMRYTAAGLAAIAQASGFRDTQPVTITGEIRGGERGQLGAPRSHQARGPRRVGSEAGTTSAGCVDRPEGRAKRHRMLRILHTADVHLGARHADLGEQASAQRERQFGAFKASVDLAISKKVDVFLIAGDLFDSNTQP